jgi:hypothetical protein
MPASLKEERLRDMKRDALSIAQNAGSPAYKFMAAEQSAGGTALDINADGAITRWTVDDTGKLLKASFKTMDPRAGGMVQREVEYSDYRMVDGITVAFKQVVRDNGELVAESTVQEIKINPAVDSKLFEKPPSQ